MDSSHPTRPTGRTLAPTSKCAPLTPQGFYRPIYPQGVPLTPQGAPLTPQTPLILPGLLSVSKPPPQRNGPPRHSVLAQHVKENLDGQAELLSSMKRAQEYLDEQAE